MADQKLGSGEILLYDNGGKKEFVSVVFKDETDRFLTNNRRKVLEGKGHISHDDAAKKVGEIYAEFRKRQDVEYVSEFDRETAKYLKGGDSR